MSSEAVAGNAPRVGAGLLTSMRLSFEEATPRARGGQSSRFGELTSFRVVTPWLPLSNVAITDCKNYGEAHSWHRLSLGTVGPSQHWHEVLSGPGWPRQATLILLKADRCRCCGSVQGMGWGRPVLKPSLPEGKQVINSRLNPKNGRRDAID
jgi:hypothetical protein